uniref:Dirigent protein n=1 Tax=Ananas comosus var. bracteatus TaxID=296719 RepID=A0A6V7QG85_ANACO|nr:unnamed protein product [Ananas comosus var. bracteatus]
MTGYHLLNGAQKRSDCLLNHFSFLKTIINASLANPNTPFFALPFTPTLPHHGQALPHSHHLSPLLLLLLLFVLGALRRADEQLPAEREARRKGGLRDAEPLPVLLARHRERAEPDVGACGAGALREELDDELRHHRHDRRPAHGGPNLSSPLVGHAQGLYSFAGKDSVGLLMAMTFVFAQGDYANSTIVIMGRNDVFSQVREMAVVGGSGLFRLARGYAQARTHTFDQTTGYTVVQYDVFVTHS